MEIINRPRGTQDIYPPRSLLYKKIFQIVQEILICNNFQPIIFPAYEYSELFKTSLDSTNDVIHKEMFVFTDRKNRNLALRPDGTICTARLILNNKLFMNGFPLKLYYLANMFRYERPQKGRYREFWQLGVELVSASGITADYQVLKIIQEIFEILGIKEFTCKLNYLGSKSTQEKYKQELKNFFKKEKVYLCQDCCRKSKDNPLRILDCKTCQKKISFPSYKIA
jgi:histidyl-tRNA synthetase